MLSEAQRVSLRITSSVRKAYREGVGLRVADSCTGNHFEDDFTPLETIRRLYSVFGRRSYLGFEGETFEPKGREYFSVLPKYRVILPTPTQTILDAPPGYIGLYTYFFSLANLRLPLNDFFCEAYDCEPSIELFCGFFNLCKADTIVPSKFPQLLLKENMLDVKSFKDKLPYEMSFRNFIYTEDDEDLTFLPKDFSPGFNTGSPSVSINTEPVRADEEPAVEPATEPVNECVKTTADSGESPKGDTFVVYAGSIAVRIRERKYEISGGSSTLRTVRAKASAIKDDAPVLSISDDDE
ncbi:hypothetical protein Tco_0963235, partial [Tanacetum coccineum]